MRGMLFRRSAGLGGLLGGLSGGIFIMFLFPLGIPIGFILGGLGGTLIGLLNAVVLDDMYEISREPVQQNNKVTIYMTSLKVTLIAVNVIYIPLFLFINGSWWMTLLGGLAVTFFALLSALRGCYMMLKFSHEAYQKTNNPKG